MGRKLYRRRRRGGRAGGVEADLPRLADAPDTLEALRKSGRLTVDYACSEACAATLTLKMGKTRLGTARATRASLGVSRVSQSTTNRALADRRSVDASVRRRCTTSL